MSSTNLEYDPNAEKRMFEATKKKKQAGVTLCFRVVCGRCAKYQVIKKRCIWLKDLHELINLSCYCGNSQGGKNQRIVNVSHEIKEDGDAYRR